MKPLESAEGLVKNLAVSLKVTPCLRIECKFWLGDDGWNGTADHLSLTVRASSFGQAKSDMEAALGKHIEALLSERTQTSKGHTA